MTLLHLTGKWLLWALLAVTFVASYLLAPPLQGFRGSGESSRMLFFHVPMAWTSFVAFAAAGVWSAVYLAKRRPEHDRAARVAVELGLVFCVLATASGSVWAKIEWGAFWNWDPRQTTIVLALVFYAAYLALREAVQDGEVAARLAGVYGVLGLVVAPFLFFVAPRMSGFSLHPEPVINQQGEVKMDPSVLWILIAGSIGFMLLFFWIHRLRCRLGALEESALAAHGWDPESAFGEELRVERS